MDGASGRILWGADDEGHSQARDPADYQVVDLAIGFGAGVAMLIARGAWRHVAAPGKIVDAGARPG